MVGSRMPTMSLAATATVADDTSSSPSSSLVLLSSPSSPSSSSSWMSDATSLEGVMSAVPELSVAPLSADAFETLLGVNFGVAGESTSQSVLVAPSSSTCSCSTTDGTDGIF